MSEDKKATATSPSYNNYRSDKTLQEDPMKNFDAIHNEVSGVNSK